MTNILLYIILTAMSISSSAIFSITEKAESGVINIEWRDSLSGDFEFKNKWEYPEGIYTNEDGQISCDGLCPPEIERMIDENGKILKDSFIAFYQLIDTTHQFHSMQSEAWSYEWAGADFVTSQRINADTVVCFSHTNCATHCSLNLIITTSGCIPTIQLHSIVASKGIKTYTCKSGKIEIDKNLWNKGILKANFDFVFDHKKNPKKAMFWKGKIYSDIKLN